MLRKRHQFNFDKVLTFMGSLALARPISVESLLITLFTPPPCPDQAHPSFKSNLFKCPVPHSHLAANKVKGNISQSIV